MVKTLNLSPQLCQSCLRVIFFCTCNFTDQTRGRFATKRGLFNHLLHNAIFFNKNLKPLTGVNFIGQILHIFDFYFKKRLINFILISNILINVVKSLYQNSNTSTNASNLFTSCSAHDNAI